MSWPVVVRSDSPEATRHLAGQLARLSASGDVILLVGELGAGKTVFAQGFAAALGVEGPVTSPTFTLMRHYRCAPGAPVRSLIHADVFRTGSLAEVEDLALAELVEEGAAALVEWGDLAAPVLGDDVVEVTLTPEEPGAGDGAPPRTVSLAGRGRWAGRAAEVLQALDGVTDAAGAGA
jgi:tRNA threonylcarbamoyladenosine biosynthesis protein TsaE